MINLNLVEKLLREYARIRGPERLFTQEQSDQLRGRLAPAVAGADVHGTASAARLRSLWTVTAFAAAWVMAAILTMDPTTTNIGPGLQVDGGFSRQELFRTMRSEVTPDAGGPYFVGVKLVRPSYVRILILDDRGLLDSLDLDRSGSAERRIGPDAETFGGYALRAVDEHGAASTIQTFMILASDRPLDDSVVAEWIESRNRTTARGVATPIERLTSDTSQNFRCTVRVVSP